MHDTELAHRSGERWRSGHGRRSDDKKGQSRGSHRRCNRRPARPLPPHGSSSGARNARGPTAEARLLYEETVAPIRLSELAAAWIPLLVSDEEAQNDLKQASTTGWRRN